LVARVAGGPDGVVPLIRKAILGVSPDVRFVQVETMANRFDKLLAPWRLGATMFVIFGLLALLVAAVGLYSLLAFGVAQRRREIGIRAALGATRPDLVRLVMTQAARFIVAGLALGMATALAVGRFLDDLLFGVAATDHVVHTLVILTVVISGALAGLVPAWRATSVSPTTAMGAE
ncbi:MAG: FtsX-like permease family protein, partial [Vicinamibacteraceae bacterium]